MSNDPEFYVLFSFTLLDGEELNHNNPATFEIPPAEIRANIKIGDSVKLIFEMTADDEHISTERMWVDVTELFEKSGKYLGKLRNTPMANTLNPRPGDGIVFEPKNVIDYIEDGAAIPMIEEPSI
jgi:hypothetical protein